MHCSCVRPKMAMYLFALLSPLCTYGCVNRWPIRMIQLGKKRPICRHHSPLCPAFSPREHSALPGHHEEDRGSILIQEHQQMHPSSSPPLKLTHFWPMLSASKIHLLHFAWSLCTKCWSFLGVWWISQNVWSFAKRTKPQFLCLETIQNQSGTCKPCFRMVVYGAHFGSLQTANALKVRLAPYWLSQGNVAPKL